MQMLIVIRKDMYMYRGLYRNLVHVTNTYPHKKKWKKLLIKIFLAVASYYSPSLDCFPQNSRPGLSHPTLPRTWQFT